MVLSHALHSFHKIPSNSFTHLLLPLLPLFFLYLIQTVISMSILTNPPPRADHLLKLVQSVSVKIITAQVHTL